MVPSMRAEALVRNTKTMVPCLQSSMVVEHHGLGLHDYCWYWGAVVHWGKHVFQHVLWHSEAKAFWCPHSETVFQHKHPKHTVTLERTLWAPGLERTLWAPGLERTLWAPGLERTLWAPIQERALELTLWAPREERTLWAPRQERTLWAPIQERALELTLWAPGLERTLCRVIVAQPLCSIPKHQGKLP